MLLPGQAKAVDQVADVKTSQANNKQLRAALDEAERAVSQSQNVQEVVRALEPLTRLGPVLKFDNSNKKFVSALGFFLFVLSFMIFFAESAVGDRSHDRRHHRHVVQSIHDSSGRWRSSCAFSRRH